MSEPVMREVRRMTLCIAVLTAVMLALFAAFGRFDLPVLYGGLLGCAVSILNFFIMSFSVEKSLEKPKTKAGSLMALSYFLRLTLIALAIVWAIKAPYFNYIAAIIPLIFIRLSVYIVTYFDNKSKGGDKN